MRPRPARRRGRPAHRSATDAMFQVHSKPAHLVFKAIRPKRNVPPLRAAPKRHFIAARLSVNTVESACRHYEMSRDGYIHAQCSEKEVDDAVIRMGTCGCEPADSCARLST